MGMRDLAVTTRWVADDRLFVVQWPCGRYYMATDEQRMDFLRWLQDAYTAWTDARWSADDPDGFISFDDWIGDLYWITGEEDESNETDGS